MSDFLPIPNAVPVRKVVTRIGDGKNKQYVIEHNLGNDFVVSVFYTKTGQPLLDLPNRYFGYVTFFFARPIEEDEITVVMMG